MLTCKDLLSLDSFKGVSVVAGRSHLDNVISWPYPKHTKVISPWVRGGEFILVSGYERGIDDQELICLLDEAEMNHLSGILVEGGVNFKTLSTSVTQHADELGIPLFFAPRVVSFLDICQEISNVLLESNFYDKYIASPLKKLVSGDLTSKKDTLLLFKEAGIPGDELYQIFLFTALIPTAPEYPDSFNYDSILHTTLQPLQNACHAAITALGIKPIVYLTASSVAYMAYGKSDEDLGHFFNAMKTVQAKFSAPGTGCELVLSSSSVTSNVMEIAKIYNQALYTASLMRDSVIDGSTRSFSELGSYQLPYAVEDKELLLAFRDRYLGELRKNEQLLETLRAYLSFNGNMLRTAESLYIHRNTLSYRIERIESLIGRRLSDMNTVRDLLNALLILDVYPY